MTCEPVGEGGAGVTAHFDTLLDLSCQIIDLEAACEYLSSREDAARAEAEYRNLHAQFAATARGMYTDILHSDGGFEAGLERLQQDLAHVRATRDLSWREPSRFMADRLSVQLRTYEARRKVRQASMGVLALVAFVGGIVEFYVS